MQNPTNLIWQLPTTSLFKITILSSALATIGLVGCSSTPQTNKTASSKGITGSSAYLDASSLDSLEDLLSATDMRAVEGDRLQILKHGDVWKRMTVGFKMDTNHFDPRIEAQRGWFISRQPYLDRLSARASRYLYHTVKEAERRGLPTELALLPVIESSYDPAATSSAAAAGLWQFIPSTGKIYGLKQTTQYDGRRDVVESTRAAYEFLGSLYNQFGSWELALAAYNAGPGRVQQAINRNQAAGLPTDFWSLKLPQETMNYVPRFLAVAQIIKNPQQYGVYLPPIANRPHFREVFLNGAVDLNEISRLTGLSRSELYALNPAYRGDRVDPESPMRILIPSDVNLTVDAKLKQLKGPAGLWAATAPANATTVTINGVTKRTTDNPIGSNVVVRNNTTTTVPTRSVPTSQPNLTAASRSTPRGSNALANFAAGADIPSAPRIPVNISPVAPVKPVRTEPPITAAERAQILGMIKQEGSHESVQQALEPMPTQAEKDQVIAELKAIAPQGTEIVDPYDGKIKLTAIQTSQSVADQEGKELTKGFAYPKSLESAPDPDVVKRNSDKSYRHTDSEIVVVQPQGKRSTYVVLPGDTLATIATKNGVSWRDIAKWNQIDPKGTLFVGTTLYLYDAKPIASVTASTSKAVVAKPETYVVQPNDSLTSVASQLGLSVKQLADLNDLPMNSGLLVGQKLNLVESSKTVASKTNTRHSAQPSRVATKVYAVKRGEFLKLIADRYALSNQELADLTPGLNAGSSLQVGQKINVPMDEVDTSSSNTPTKEIKASSATANIKTENYKVKSGDSLSSISAQAGISLADFIRLNNLTVKSTILPGQILKVPASTVVPTKYTVQSGDSLNSVANKFDLQINDLAEINGLRRNAGLRVGQVLKLSSDEAESATKSTAKTSKADTSVQTTSSSAASSKKGNTEGYNVKSGESLALIANRYGMSIKELADLNQFSVRVVLHPNQEIQVPKQFKEYKVKRGDNLNVVANRAGISVAELAELNNIKPTASLRTGELLKIPNS